MRISDCSSDVCSSDLPFEMLEKAGLLDDDKLRLRDKQQRTIGTVYETIRRINRQVGELISDQFELVEDGEHIKRVLDEKVSSKAAAKVATTPRKTTQRVQRTPVKKRAVKRSEEHTTELKSLMRHTHAVLCSKNNNNNMT